MENNRRRMPLPGKILIAIAVLLCLVLAAILLFPMLKKGGTALQQHLRLGQRYLDELDYNNAVLEFTSAIEIDGRSTPAYVGRGQAYLGLQEYSRAEQDFTFVIENLDAGNVDAYVGRAQSYIAHGETDKAMADIDRAEANGLSQTRADDLRRDAENALSGSDGKTTRRVLTADDVTWILQPTYVYQDLEPIRQDRSSLYAWNTEDYSPFPQLYQATVSVRVYEDLLFPDQDIIDMTSMTTLSQVSSGSFQAYFPFVVPEQMALSATAVAHLCLGDFSPDGPTTLPESFAGGNVSYGTMTDVGMSAGAIYDSTTREIFVEEHNTVAGSPVYEIRSFVDLATAFVKPVPVYQWAVSSYLQPGTDNNYILPDAADVLPEYPVISAQPQDTLFAFVSPDGTLLTDFLYEDTVDYSCGIAAAKLNGKWGYLDETGTPVTDFIYDSIWAVTNSEEYYDAFPCTCDTMVVSRDGQTGLLYRDGSVLIDFGEFEDLAPAYNDQLWAMQDGAWGLIDLNDVKTKAGCPIT